MVPLTSMYCGSAQSSLERTFTFESSARGGRDDSDGVGVGGGGGKRRGEDEGGSDETRARRGSAAEEVSAEAPSRAATIKIR